MSGYCKDCGNTLCNCEPTDPLRAKIAEIWASHHKFTPRSRYPREIECAHCEREWPCDASLALNALEEALRERSRLVEALEEWQIHRGAMDRVKDALKAPSNVLAKAGEKVNTIEIKNYQATSFPSIARKEKLLGTLGFSIFFGAAVALALLLGFMLFLSVVGGSWIRCRSCCLKEAVLTKEDIKRVIAYRWIGDGGYKDAPKKSTESSSYAVLELKGGRVAVFSESEDYTGHGCQCSSSLTIHDNLREAVTLGLGDEDRRDFLRDLFTAVEDASKCDV